MSREKSDLLRISDQFAIDGKAENVESHGNGRKSSWEDNRRWRPLPQTPWKDC